MVVVKQRSHKYGPKLRREKKMKEEEKQEEEERTKFQDE